MSACNKYSSELSGNKTRRTFGLTDEPDFRQSLTFHCSAVVDMLTTTGTVVGFSSCTCQRRLLFSSKLGYQIDLDLHLDLPVKQLLCYNKTSFKLLLGGKVHFTWLLGLMNENSNWRKSCLSCNLHWEFVLVDSLNIAKVKVILFSIRLSHKINNTVEECKMFSFLTKTTDWNSVPKDKQTRFLLLIFMTFLWHLLQHVGPPFRRPWNIGLCVIFLR